MARKWVILADTKLGAVHVTTDYSPASAISTQCTVNTHSTAQVGVPEVCVANADDDDAHGLPGRLHQRRLL
jgi:hypothetical protein